LPPSALEIAALPSPNMMSLNKINNRVQKEGSPMKQKAHSEIRTARKNFKQTKQRAVRFHEKLFFLPLIILVMYF